MLKTKGYSFWTFPECTSAVVTEFPVRSMLSYLIAPWRVYPALGKYFKVGGHGIYLLHSTYIYFEVRSQFKE